MLTTGLIIIAVGALLVGGPILLGMTPGRRRQARLEQAAELRRPALEQQAQRVRRRRRRRRPARS